MILKNEFFFASPASFNDPFDFCCHTNIDYESIRYLMKDFCADTLSASENEIMFYRKILSLPKIEQIPYLFARRKKINNIFKRIIKGLFKVLSTSTVADCLPQWAYYSNSHFGFCVEIDVHEFFISMESANLPKSAYIIHDSVHYSDAFPHLHVRGSHLYPQEELTVPLLRKALSWEREKEYRFILRTTETLNKSIGEKIVLAYNHSVISAVYFGCRYKENEDYDDNVQPIINACRERGIPIYVAHQHPREYKLEFEPLED